jgi:hypothetical protein
MYVGQLIDAKKKIEQHAHCLQRGLKMMLPNSNHSTCTLVFILNIPLPRRI